MEIVIIGTGNTATILGKKLKGAGHDIIQIYGRDAAAASELAYELDTESTNYWAVVNRNADVYIIAVSDIAVEEMVKELQLPDKTIVHTAASVSKEVLKKDTSHFGVFYPLQSLRKNAEILPDIPIIIGASDDKTFDELQKLALTISDKVIQADDNERLKIHLAAVFCNNFVNHILQLAQQYCTKEGIDFKILTPLIKETISRVDFTLPSEAQTGPAVRNDQDTIEKHLELLEKHPNLKEVYNFLTSSIQNKI